MKHALNLQITNSITETTAEAHQPSRSKEMRENSCDIERSGEKEGAKSPH